MRTNLLFIILVWLCGINAAWPQAEPSFQLESTEEAIPFAEGITPDDLREHLTTLASDEFQGRETGTEGQRKAARYIADAFAQLGFPKIGDQDSYFQKIAFISENWDDISITLNDTMELRHLWNYYAYLSTNQSVETTAFKELVFLGFGIDDERYSDYKKADVAGKAILIYDGEPVNQKGVSQVTHTTELSEWSTNWKMKLKAAQSNGVTHVFIIDRNFRSNVADARRIILNRRLKYGEEEAVANDFANNTFITSDIGREIIGSSIKKVLKSRAKAEKKGKLKPVILRVNIRLTQEKYVRSITGENVLGFIEGSDEALKDEVVIVTAHYDHLGIRGEDIYNGADDNASGTSTVLEVSQAFAEAQKAGKGPRRSVLTMLVSGEEKGLLGSAFYADHPVFPLANTIANVNVDMVGRVDEKHQDNPNYIYVIGSDRLSTELHQINELANLQYTKLELDYTYNAEDDPNRYYYRSDHYNFAEKGIPAIFYFNGTHDDYHRTTDTVEKINFDKMAKIARLVFFTTWELANRDNRIVVDVKE